MCDSLREQASSSGPTGEDALAAACCLGLPRLPMALCLALVIMLLHVTAQGQAHRLQPLPL